MRFRSCVLTQRALPIVWPSSRGHDKSAAETCFPELQDLLWQFVLQQGSFPHRHRLDKLKPAWLTG